MFQPRLFEVPKEHDQGVNLNRPTYSRNNISLQLFSILEANFQESGCNDLRFELSTQQPLGASSAYGKRVLNLSIGTGQE